MFNNTAFPSLESMTQTMKANAEKFTPAQAQEAFKPMAENLKAWGELAQKQAHTAQSAMAQAMEAFKGITDPKAAFEAMKVSAEASVAIATQNLKDVTALSVAQFNSSVEAMEKTNSVPEVFANVGKGLKTAATNMQTAVESAMKNNSKAKK